MGPQTMLMVAANIFFVAAGLLLGLGFAFKFRNVCRQRVTRIEEFYLTNFEGRAKPRLVA